MWGSEMGASEAPSQRPHLSKYRTPARAQSWAQYCLGARCVTGREGAILGPSLGVPAGDRPAGRSPGKARGWGRRWGTSPRVFTLPHPESGSMADDRRQGQNAAPRPGPTWLLAGHTGAAGPWRYCFPARGEGTVPHEAGRAAGWPGPAQPLAGSVLMKPGNLPPPAPGEARGISPILVWAQR